MGDPMIQIFMMMKIFNLVSFCGIVILWLNYYANAEPHKEGKVIITENGQTRTVHLKPAKSFLMNENLPIWVVRDGELFEIDTDDVMEQLGPFTIYQDSNSSTAAVYFHKRRAFDGTIDARYFIEGLNPDSVDENHTEDEETNNFQSIFPIFERRDWGHPDRIIVTGKERVAPTFFSEWMIGESNDEKPSDAPCRKRSRIFYVETLIVINHKMANELLRKHSGVSAIVSYVLTLFNTVDMLFSKLNRPNIKMNIAGIIIENNRDSIPNMAQCYEQIEKFGKVVEGMNGICADNHLRSYLLKQKRLIPLDSYDVSVYLARYLLHEHRFNEETQEHKVAHLAGTTSNPPGGTYENRMRDGKFRASAIVSDFGSFGSFATIAHEMIHAFGLLQHDNKIGMKNGVCMEKLMKAYDGHCPQCLDWSEFTKQLVQFIFRSRDRCIYINEPRSLYPSGPRRMLTANEQCQCYGHAFAENTQEVQEPQMFCLRVFPGTFAYCNDYLQCVGRDGNIHSAPVPMDGTPCEEHKFPNKVCWGRVCDEIES